MENTAEAPTTSQQTAAPVTTIVEAITSTKSPPVKNPLRVAQGKRLAAVSQQGKANARLRREGNASTFSKLWSNINTLARSNVTWISVALILLAIEVTRVSIWRPAQVAEQPSETPSLDSLTMPPTPSTPPPAVSSDSTKASSSAQSKGRNPNLDKWDE